MPDDFFERIPYLMDQVGDGTLSMGTVIQQPYAGAEHNRLYYKHPRGGTAKWIEGTLAMQVPQYMMILTLSAVVPTGSELKPAAIRVSELMAGVTRKYAPVMSGLLRESADSFVYDAGALIYFRDQSGPYNYDKDG